MSEEKITEAIEYLKLMSGISMPNVRQINAMHNAITYADINLYKDKNHNAYDFIDRSTFEEKAFCYFMRNCGLCDAERRHYFFMRETNEMMRLNSLRETFTNLINQ